MKITMTQMMLPYMVTALVFLVLSLKTSPSRAEDFIEWQGANVQLLRGWNYAVGDDKRSIATFEYANRWRYGDFFMFVDATAFHQGALLLTLNFHPDFPSAV